MIIEPEVVKYISGVSSVVLAILNWTVHVRDRHLRDHQDLRYFDKS